MFDIGFWELAIIGVVALLVIGPERLPAVARTAGLWLGRGRRFVAGVKADIDREIKADELKRIMKEQAESSGIHEIIEETRDTLSDTRDTFEETRHQLDELDQVEDRTGRSEPSVEKQPLAHDDGEQPTVKGGNPADTAAEIPEQEPPARKDNDER